MKVCVIGAGYVGLVTSLVLAKMNNKVICVERDIDKVALLNNGIPTIYENGLQKVLKECLSSKTIYFTNDINIGVKTSDIIFIGVGTPEMEDGDADMTQVYQVIEQLSTSIDSYKVIINKSTVPVGTQKEITNILIKMGVPNENFDVVSNPEFLREGRAFDDFFNADRIVIGCNSEKSRDVMLELYKPFNSEIIVTNPETAELMKYASNAFLATKISFINEIANLCNKVGADIETIAYGMGLDKRISPMFLKAGIGFGGSCFPKDSKALIKIGEKNNIDFKIIRSVIEVNEVQRVLPVEMLVDRYKDLKDKTITILGLSFKPETDDTREAPALYIINELLRKEAKIKVYDPIASKSIIQMFPDVKCYNDVYDAAIDSDCIIICTEWRQFNDLDYSEIKNRMNYPMIIDGRNMLDLSVIKRLGFEYYSIGRNKNKGL